MIDAECRLPQNEAEKHAIRCYLAHRLSGVRKALATLTECQKSDPTSFSMQAWAYYKHVEGYLVQCQKQLEQTNVNR